MRDLLLIRERYMLDPLQIRLGGIAANLSGVRSFARDDADSATVESILEEGKYFIEWPVPEMEIETAAQLVQIQVELAKLQQNWATTWSDRARRRTVARQTNLWAQHILKISGLLDT
ncbi:MAG: hypothetical protein NTX17_00205 [Candidatus Eisenbacteria bacterium]|nr:hypothetical protein [Candidatus Eisenbacteria bacterium]